MGKKLGIAISVAIDFGNYDKILQLINNWNWYISLPLYLIIFKKQLFKNIIFI